MAESVAAAAQSSVEQEQAQHDDKEEEEAKGRQLLEACQAGDAFERVETLLREGAPAYYQARD